MSAVELSDAVTPPVVSSPTVGSLSTTVPLSASDLATAVYAVLIALKDKDLRAAITALPTLVADIYLLIMSFTDSGLAGVQSTVMEVISHAITVSTTLSETDKQALQQVVSAIVPSLVALYPRIEAGVVRGFTELEDETVTCAQALWRVMMCKCTKQD